MPKSGRTPLQVLGDAIEEIYEIQKKVGNVDGLKIEEARKVYQEESLQEELKVDIIPLEKEDVKILEKNWFIKNVRDTYERIFQNVDHEKRLEANIIWKEFRGLYKSNLTETRSQMFTYLRRLNELSETNRLMGMGYG